MKTKVNKKPLISIVTTVYNLQDKINKCLSSIIEQTYKNLEIIIVNDCSTDNSINEINSFVDDRICIINHEQNYGAGQSRKTGIERATGEYVITIDGDDYISKDFIEKLVNNAIATNADIVSGGITIVHSNTYEEIKRFMPHISEGFNKFSDYGDGKIIFLNNKLVRRTLYDIVPYSSRRYCEDTPVILPLLYYANKVSYEDTQGYYYVQHNASLCHKVNHFEDALFKALCSYECKKFFYTKEKEYHNIISNNEFINYIKIIKNTANDELLQKYSNEVAELTPAILSLMNI